MSELYSLDSDHEMKAPPKKRGRPVGSLRAPKFFVYQNIGFTKEEDEYITNLAKKTGKPKQWWIRNLIRLGIKTHERGDYEF